MIIESLEIFNSVYREFGTDYGLYNLGYALYTFTTFTNVYKLCINEPYNCFQTILEDPKSKPVFKEKSKNMINLILESCPKEFLEEEIEDNRIIEVPDLDVFKYFLNVIIK